MAHSLPAAGRVLAAALAWAIILAAAPGGQAKAETLFDGSKARVNLSSKLLMLSQMVGSASCRISAGIGAEAARVDLAMARGEFNTIIAGLERGGPALGIPTGERYSVVKRSIAAVREIWAPIDVASEMLLAGDGDAQEAARVIGETNLALLDAANILASDISGKYSNPHELTQSDAMALLVAGRQRMLGHRIAKEVCGIATGEPTFGTPEALKQTVGLYQISLQALREGMPDAGVNPPPNEVIRTELDTVLRVWTGHAPTLAVFGDNRKPSPENVETVAGLSSNLMTDMSNVVTLYMLATPGQDDVYRVPLHAYAENELSAWVNDPALIAAIRAQNKTHGALSQAEIDALDQTWRAEAKSEGGPLISDLLARPVSGWLREKQAETANFVTEVFAMDNRGLNVAQNVETSDYWQGDEAKWQETVGNGSGLIHISEVEYDESTGFYQSQVSMPVRDPATGALIGAVTFGINVQSLL